jgi:transcriptional regulator
VADQMPLVKGTLDVLVLKALAWAPMHGFEITSWLEERSAGALGVEDSALYQALHRMEERGLVGAAWGVTANNRRARYYRLTPAGQAHLRAESTRLVRYAETVTAILTGPAGAAEGAS